VILTKSSDPAAPSETSPMRSFDVYSQPAQRSTNFSGTQTAVLFVVLALVASIPLITHPLPPLTDYVNHLARMHVIASIGKDLDLSRFYEIDWQIVPNLMMDIVIPPLVRFMTVYHAGQVFTVLTFLLIISGTVAFNRALFSSWSVLPLVAFPLLYNHVFLVGVMNYMFGIGLALWGLAVWVALRERLWLVRLLVSAGFVLAMFFCHLFAVALYGMGLFAIEVHRLWEQRDRPWGRRIADFVATGLPFLPVVPLLLKSPTWQLAAENYWDQQGKIDGLIYLIEAYSDIVACLLTAVAAFAIGWAARHRLLRLHSVGWLILAIAGIVYLAMPRVVFATYMADQRLPIAAAFMVIACLHLDLHHRLVRREFLALLLALLVVRVIEVDVNWAELSRETLEFRDSVKRIKRGSTVLVAYADRSAGDDVHDANLVHAACLAMIERSALVTTAFTVPGKQIMHVRREYAERVDTEDGTPPALDQLMVAATQHSEPQAYWELWPSRFDYVYVLFTDEDTPNPAPELLTLLHEGERFQLYRVNKERTATGRR
jgi:hypothetical protein